MPFRKVGADDYVSPSGRHWTGAQVRLYHATKGFTKKPRRRRKTREALTMFTTLTYADILREERVRLREHNDCHVPSGPSGGQFCSKGGGGGAPTGGRPATGARAQVSQDWRDAMTSAGLRTDVPGKIKKAKAPAADIPDIQTMPVSQLAALARKDWGAKTNYAAKPYLSAMTSLNKITDPYGADPGEMIVGYFLGNATTWRGPVAKAVKAELKRRLGRR